MNTYSFRMRIPFDKGRVERKEDEESGEVTILFAPKVKKGEKRPRLTAIGIECEFAPNYLFPNDNYFKLIPKSEKDDTDRSSILRVGTYFVLSKIMKKLPLDAVLETMDVGWSELALDMAAYMITMDENHMTKYSDYSYNHPQFTYHHDMYCEQILARSYKNFNEFPSFVSVLAAAIDKEDRIYISLGSSEMKDTLGDIKIVEKYPVEKKEDALLHYALAYDKDNARAIDYLYYGDCFNDVKVLQHIKDQFGMWDYENLAFILDQGVVAKDALSFMDENNYPFMIQMNGDNPFVKELVTECKEERGNGGLSTVQGYFMLKAKTVTRKLFKDDSKERYFHIFYADRKGDFKRQRLYRRLGNMTAFIQEKKGKECLFSSEYEEYFHIEKEDGKILGYQEKNDRINEETFLADFFVIITSEKMTAQEALNIYDKRGSLEEFKDSIRDIENESNMERKFFVAYVAQVFRSMIYSQMVNERRKHIFSMEYTFRQLIRELEKIEMVKQADGNYILDHELNEEQKSILQAFSIDEKQLAEMASNLNKEMRSARNRIIERNSGNRLFDTYFLDKEEDDFILF